MVRGGVPMTVATKISGHKTASIFRRHDICDERDLGDAMTRVEQYHEAEAKKIVSAGSQT
jgi:hypothetical protein